MPSLGFLFLRAGFLTLSAGWSASLSCGTHQSTLSAVGLARTTVGSHRLIVRAAFGSRLAYVAAVRASLVLVEGEGAIVQPRFGRICAFHTRCRRCRSNGSQTTSAEESGFALSRV